MSRVIRSRKIDGEIFPLVIQQVVPVEAEPDSPQEEQEVEEKIDIEEMRALIEKERLASEEKARRIIASAEEKSRQILDQAREQGYNEGFSQGIEEGRKRGLAEVAEQVEKMRVQAKVMLDTAEDMRTRLIRGAEEEVVELAMTIASRVIHSHVEVKRDTVVSLACQALERAVAAGYYTIFVNPEDVELLKEYISELRRSASGSARIHIIPDDSISMGGCKVETESGMVDVTLESQLEQIRKTLREVVEGNG